MRLPKSAIPIHRTKREVSVNTGRGTMSGTPVRSPKPVLTARASNKVMHFTKVRKSRTCKWIYQPQSGGQILLRHPGHESSKYLLYWQITRWHLIPTWIWYFLPSWRVIGEIMSSTWTWVGTQREMPRYGQESGSIYKCTYNYTRADTLNNTCCSG